MEYELKAKYLRGLIPHVFLGGWDHQSISYYILQTTYTYFDHIIRKTMHIKSYEQNTMIFSWSIVLNCYSNLFNYSILHQLKSTPKRHKNSLMTIIYNRDAWQTMFSTLYFAHPKHYKLHM